MALNLALSCVAAFLAIAVMAVALGRVPAAGRIVYATCLVVSAIGFCTALATLVGAAPPLVRTLPLGVPWIGAHLRLDMLSAFFLAVVDLGAAAASLFALGYDWMFAK